jgi:hypothetical protein
MECLALKFLKLLKKPRAQNKLNPAMDHSALKLLKTSSNPAEKLEEIPKKDLGNRGFKNPAKSSTENPRVYPKIFSKILKKSSRPLKPNQISGILKVNTARTS